MFKKLIKKAIVRTICNNNIDIRIMRLRLEYFMANHSDISLILSLDDSPGPPDSMLLNLFSVLINDAMNIKLSLLSERKAPSFVHLWPGEHYRLLGALVHTIRPKRVVEIGTYTGLSSLAILMALPSDSSLTTIDIVPWNNVKGSFLRVEDFQDGRFQQIIADPSTQNVYANYIEVFKNADVIFVDAAKDGIFEQKLIDNFKLFGVRDGAIVIFDDIRFMNMINIWRNIEKPKLDITSIGHWTGTGIVHWVI